MTVASLMNTYARTHFAVAAGKGVWLTDGERRTYLDCVQGIATNAVGHAHPPLVAALTQQARKIWHVSNIFREPAQEELSRRLVEASYADVVFFAA